jgi:hypothetical protein
MVETTDSDRLLKVLDDLEGLLLQYGESFWAECINGATTRIRNSEEYGLDELLGFFGGMGSINDLIICPENGHRITHEDEPTVNMQLASLVEQASTLVHEVRLQHQAKIQ